jgi:hypothetical protein
MKLSGPFRSLTLFAAIITLFTLFSLEAGRLQAQEPAKPQFVFPALPESLGSGSLLVLKVESKKPDDYEYQWHTKWCQDDWTAAEDWPSSATYTFTPLKPGLYALQVNIRNRSDKTIVTQKWLGELPVQGELVRKIIYSPAAVCLPEGTPLHFFLEADGGFPPERLEFLLWSLLPTNKVVVNWQAWPLPDFILRQTGESNQVAVQVDIRLKAYPQVVHKIWLNTFYLSPKEPKPIPNLLRSLLADDFAIKDPKSAAQVQGEELSLVLNLLYWEHSKLPADEQMQKIKTLRCVKSVERKTPENLRVVLACGQAYTLDLKERQWHQEGSPLTLRFALDAFPSYENVYGRFEKDQEEIALIAGMTYAVYAGYYYGTAPNYILENAADSIAHCGTLVRQLHDLLEDVGTTTSYVAISVQGASHRILQTSVNGVYYLLDPSAGFIYRFSADQLGKAPIPIPIVLPQQRTLDFLNLQKIFRNYSPKFDSVLVFDKVYPNVVPACPAPVQSPAGEKQ